MFNAATLEATGISSTVASGALRRATSAVRSAHPLHTTSTSSAPGRGALEEAGKAAAYHGLFIMCRYYYGKVGPAGWQTDTRSTSKPSRRGGGPLVPLWPTRQDGVLGISRAPDHFYLARRAGAAASRASVVTRMASSASARATYIGVPASHRSPQLPRSSKQRSVPEPLSRPVVKVIYGLGSRSSVEVSLLVSSADDTEDLDVENMGCRLVAVRPEPISDVFGAGAPDEHLSKAGCINHQHQAKPHAARRGPSALRHARLPPLCRVSLTQTAGGCASANLLRSAACEADGLGSEQLGHADTGLCSSSGKFGIHLVVKVTDLHGLRHVANPTCTNAPHHASLHEQVDGTTPGGLVRASDQPGGSV